MTYEFYVSRKGLVDGAYHFTVDYDSAVPGVFVFRYLATGGAADDGANGAKAALGSQGSESVLMP